MINLKNYSKDTFLFHKNVIEKKNIRSADPNYKHRVSKLNPDIESQHKIYNYSFNANTLENIVPFHFSAKNKGDLRDLYVFKSKPIQDLKIKLTTTDKNRVISTCQYCTINSINSFDHYLPKEEYSEFSVNPLNLIPCCTECNGHKLVNWKENNKRIFLNLYLDKLPKDQYLFVDLTINTSSIKTHFYLQKQKNMNDNLFNTLYEHYKRLHLFERFSKNSDEVISSLDNTILSFVKQLSIKEVIRSVEETSNRNRSVFGYNYWKSILEIALVNNYKYINRIKK